MSVAPVDQTDIPSTDNYISKLNTAVGLNEESTANDSSLNEYIYAKGSFQFLLEKGFKAETLINTTTTLVPFLPNWHKGIVSIHGLIIPVIDLEEYMSNSSSDASLNTEAKSYLLKLEHKDYNPIAFILDTLPQLRDTKDHKKVAKNASKPKWIKNYIKKGDSKIAVLDHKELFKSIINNQ